MTAPDDGSPPAARRGVRALPVPRRRPGDTPPEPSRPAWPDLPETLAYQGEFGAEIVLFLPFVTWLSAAGFLAGRRVSTYRGMACFYRHLDCAGVIERDERRGPYQMRMPGWMPALNEHVLRRNPYHLYPDLRAQFAALPLSPDPAADGAPLLIVHNKYTRDRKGLPVNFIDEATLDCVLGTLKRAFRVVYIRHGKDALPGGYSEDHNSIMPLDDAAVLRAHPEVLDFDVLYAAHLAAGGGLDLNSWKNALYARCHRFVTVQGGGAHHIACFKGSLIVVLHRGGQEVRLPYTDDGYYGFMANPAPLRAICRTQEELLAALPLFDGGAVTHDRLSVAAPQAALLDRFSPNRLAPRR